MDLSREEVERLRAPRPWLRKRQQPYGRQLEDVVRDASDMEFLVDAVDAVDTGHVPELEGIKMVTEAYRYVAESAARRSVAGGKHDWAADDLYGTAVEFRAMADRLRQDADTLEALGLELGVSATSDSGG